MIYRTWELHLMQTLSLALFGHDMYRRSRGMQSDSTTYVKSAEEESRRLLPILLSTHFLSIQTVGCDLWREEHSTCR